jgi:CTP synthase
VPQVIVLGALDAIRWARETGRPFLGTCGGFQHALIEFARNVLGIKDADSTEMNPNTPNPVIDMMSEQKNIVNLIRTFLTIHLLIFFYYNHVTK